MPYETDIARDARLAAKKARAKELASQERERESSIRASALTALRSQYLRGTSDLAVLLGGISERSAYEISRRADFPKPKVIGERIRLWPTKSVLEWIEAQPEVEA